MKGPLTWLAGARPRLNMSRSTDGMLARGVARLGEPAAGHRNYLEDIEGHRWMFAQLAASEPNPEL